MSTLAEILARRAHDSPDQLAYTFDGRAWTYAEVWEEAGSAASWLATSGVHHGDRVLIALENGPAFFAAFYGAQWLGATAVPVFPGLGEAQRARLAERSRAAAVLVDADWPDAAPPPPLADAHPDDIAFLQYTSGSTGEPKGVMLSHRDVLTNVDQMVAGMAITPEDRFVSWLPTYHDMGLILMTIVPFALGADLHVLPTSLRRVASWFEMIAEVGGTVTAAPDFAYRLALRRVSADVDVSSLRMALNAAEPVRAKTIEAFDERVGREGVMVAGYGLAECTVGVTTWPPGTRPSVDDRGIVSVGPPFPNIEVRIAEDGEILVKSPANAAGYDEDPEATAEAFGDDGYVRTGDLGFLDEDGNLYIEGRKKEIIIVAGRNLAPQEITAIVDDRPEVRMSAAVGIDRGDLAGEQLHVVAEVRSVEDAHALAVGITADLWTQLGVRPARVHLVSPGTIPLTPNGKLRTAELRALLTDSAETDVALYSPHSR